MIRLWKIICGATSCHGRRATPNRYTNATPHPSIQQQPDDLARTMGQFHFAVPSGSQPILKQTLWKDAYICGIEGVPWECRNTVEDGILSIDRPVDTSGKLYLTCPTKGLGYRTLSTCSLMPTRRRTLCFWSWRAGAVSAPGCNRAAGSERVLR